LLYRSNKPYERGQIQNIVNGLSRRDPRFEVHSANFMDVIVTI